MPQSFSHDSAKTCVKVVDSLPNLQAAVLVSRNSSSSDQTRDDLRLGCNYIFFYHHHHRYTPISRYSTSHIPQSCRPKASKPSARRRRPPPSPTARYAARTAMEMETGMEIALGREGLIVGEEVVAGEKLNVE